MTHDSSRVLLLSIPDFRSSLLYGIFVPQFVCLWWSLYLSPIYISKYLLDWLEVLLWILPFSDLYTHHPLFNSDGHLFMILGSRTDLVIKSRLLLSESSSISSLSYLCRFRATAHASLGIFVWMRRPTVQQSCVRYSGPGFAYEIGALPVVMTATNQVLSMTGTFTLQRDSATPFLSQLLVNGQKVCRCTLVSCSLWLSQPTEATAYTSKFLSKGNALILPTCNTLTGQSSAFKVLEVYFVKWYRFFSFALK